jgi:hypothetical protein
MTNESGADVRPGIKERADRPESVKPGALPGPTDAAFSNHEFNFGLAFVEKSRRL